MPFVEVWVDVPGLDDFSDDELREELVAREKRKGQRSNYGPDFRIPKVVAKETLDQAAQVFRRDGRHDIAFKLDEIRADFIDC
jgi:hypothetical protein